MREHLIIRIIYISFPILEVLRASVGYLCTRTRPPFLLIFYHLRFQRVARNHIFLFYFSRRRGRKIRYVSRWTLDTLDVAFSETKDRSIHLCSPIVELLLDYRRNRFMACLNEPAALR